MDEISLEDLEMLYNKTLVLYKGSPVFVSSINGDRRLNIFHLETQKSEYVDWSFEDFKPPTRRIGMVNCHNTVIYVTRQPYRKYQVGMSPNNMYFEYIRDVAQDVDYISPALTKVKKLHGREVLNALKGDYPSLTKALKAVKEMEKNGSMAFDHQFAVTKNKEIIYKTSKVGTVSVKGEITFDKGFEHLEIMIGDNCEKTLRTTRTR